MQMSRVVVAIGDTPLRSLREGMLSVPNTSPNGTGYPLHESQVLIGTSCFKIYLNYT